MISSRVSSIFPLAATTIVAICCFTIIIFVEARIAVDVSHGDTLPLFASFRIGTSVKTHRRPMARKYHPIVGVHRVITVPNFHSLATEDAKLALDAALEAERKKSGTDKDNGEDDPQANAAADKNDRQALEEMLVDSEGLYDARHVSTMFHVGRMGARTPWISVVRHPIQRASPESQAKAAFAGSFFGRGGNKNKEEEGKEIPNKIEFLEELKIFFDTVPSPEGHPTSSVTKMTFSSRYSPKPVNMTLEYIWREQKSYNPELAISVAGVVAIVSVSVLAVVMFSGRDALKRELVVKIRDE